ncbi:MAG: iron-sulfur cluster assembly scaffold protein [archaeon]
MKTLNSKDKKKNTSSIKKDFKKIQKRISKKEAEECEVCVDAEVAEGAVITKEDKQKASTYSEKTIDYYLNPRNLGKIENASGIGFAKNPVCGDITTFYIKIENDKKTKKEIIKDIKFQTLGCVAAVSSASITTELVREKPLSFAKNLNKEKIMNSLENLPKVKRHCSELAIRALDNAIKDYENKKLKIKSNNKKHTKLKNKQSILFSKKNKLNSKKN